MASYLLSAAKGRVHRGPSYDPVATLLRLNPLFFFDPDWSAGLTLSGSNVTAMMDRTGAVTVSPTTTATGPTRTAMPSGRMALSLNGSQYLRNLSLPTAIANALAGNGAYWTCSVLETSVAAPQAFLAFQYSSTFALACRLYSTTVDNYRMSSGIIRSSSAYTSGANVVYSSVYDGSAGSIWMGATKVVNAIADSTSVNTPIYMTIGSLMTGGSQIFAGTIGPTLLFAGTPAAGAREAAAQALSIYTGVSL